MDGFIDPKALQHPNHTYESENNRMTHMKVDNKCNSVSTDVYTRIVPANILYTVSV